MDSIFQVGQKAIILNRNKEVLILKLKNERFPLLDQSKEYWDLPGGRVQDEESLMDALLRECYEELGLKVNVKGHITTAISPVSKKEARLLLNFYWCGIPDNSDIKIDEETDEYRWVHVDKLDELLSHKCSSQAVADIVTFINGINLKVA